MLRLLYEVHRWLGIALAVLMTLWFCSGLVIIYGGTPIQSRTQQLAHAEPLNIYSGWVSLGEVWDNSVEQRKLLLEKLKASAPKTEGSRNEASSNTKGAAKKPETQSISDARLLLSAGEPYWVVESGKDKRFAFSAIDGNLHEFNQQQALLIAKNWLSHEGDTSSVLSDVETVDKDILLRNQESYRPFHRVTVDDGNGTQLLISARTGDVISVSNYTRRALFYVGNWLHLFRPLDFIGFSDSRRTVLTWAGGLAFVASLTGIIIGWIRWRPGLLNKPTYSQGRTQPYREFWQKWHFWSGLIGGVLFTLWAFSGYLDNNPFKLFSPNNNATPQEINRYLGDALPPVMRDWHPSSVGEAESSVVELVWKKVGQEATLLAYLQQGQRVSLALKSDKTGFSQVNLLNAAKRVVKDSNVASATLLTHYDSYYYPRPGRNGLDRPLPVLHVTMQDAAASHLYIDPQDGKLLLKNDKSRRIMRWIFPALHYWDFAWLNHRPLWDAWMLTWISFGLVLSVSSVVIGWKRLKLTFRPAKKKIKKPADVGHGLTEKQFN